MLLVNHCLQVPLRNVQTHSSRYICTIKFIVSKWVCTLTLHFVCHRSETICESNRGWYNDAFTTSITVPRPKYPKETARQDEIIYEFCKQDVWATPGNIWCAVRCHLLWVWRGVPWRRSLSVSVMPCQFVMRFKTCVPENLSLPSAAVMVNLFRSKNQIAL